MNKQSIFRRINGLLFFFFSSILIMSMDAAAQTNKPVADYLGVPGPILFESKAFNLSWTAHPAVNFYKQEYLVKGENADKYKKMILTDVVTGEVNIKDVVSAKINELKKMKENNPVINYEIIDNPKTGEYMLDFLISANAPDGTISIVERNVYRYKTFTDKAGHKGVLLFGVSVRAYGAAVTPFIAALKTNRKELMNTMAQFKMPEITVLK